MRLYNHQQTLQILGIAPAILQRLVKRGQIRKVIPPGNIKRGLYVAEDVDKVAQEIKSFNKIYQVVESPHT